MEAVSDTEQRLVGSRQDATATRDDSVAATRTVCTLRKHQHDATLQTRVVHGVGRELILSIDAEWRRMRVFGLRDSIDRGGHRSYGDAAGTIRIRAGMTITDDDRGSNSTGSVVGRG